MTKFVVTIDFIKRIDFNIEARTYEEAEDQAEKHARFMDERAIKETSGRHKVELFDVKTKAEFDFHGGQREARAIKEALETTDPTGIAKYGFVMKH